MLVQLYYQTSVFALYFHLCICLCLVFAFMCVIYLVFSFADLHLPCNCICVNLFTLFCHWPPPGALLAPCAVIVSDLCRAWCSIHFKYERLIQTSGDILNFLCHYSTKALLLKRDPWRVEQTFQKLKLIVIEFYYVCLSFCKSMFVFVFLEPDDKTFQKCVGLPHPQFFCMYLYLYLCLSLRDLMARCFGNVEY